MLLIFGSIALAFTGLLSMFLVARKKRAGWIIGIACDLLSLPYDITTRQYGYVATSAVALAIAGSAFRRWKQ